MASTACCCFSPSSHGRPHSLHPHLPTITTSTTHARLRLRLVSRPAPSRCPLQISSSLSPPTGRVYFGDGAQFVDPDPGHSYQEIRQQIFGSDDASGPAKMNGFVQQARSIGGGNMTDAVMNGFAPDSVAVYRELVSQFAVCDRWFAFVPSSTQPNRLFVHSGTSGGATSNNPEFPCSGGWPRLAEELGRRYKIWEQQLAMM